MSKSYRVFIGLLLLLLLSGTYLQFSDIGKGMSLSRSFKELWNLGHIAFFAVLIYLLHIWSPLTRFSLKTQWATYLCLTFLIGVMIEYLQMATNRSSDWMDVSRDMVGCLLVLAFAPALSVQSTLLKTGLRVFVLVLLLIHLLPLKVALIDEALARHHFPLLADFSTPFELDRWSGNARKEVLQLDTEAGHHMLRVDFGTDLYSSAGLDYFEQDWRGFDFVKLNIYQPDPEPLRATVRIHDKAHEQGSSPYTYNDRFNQRIWLNPGWNLVQIPLDDVKAAPLKRSMDLTRMSNLMLFTTRLKTPRVVYLDEIYLSN